LHSSLSQLEFDTRHIPIASILFFIQRVKNTTGFAGLTISLKRTQTIVSILIIYTIIIVI